MHEPVSSSYSPIPPASSIGDVAVKRKLRRKINQNETSVAERSKYHFEADGDDVMDENEIDANLAALSVAAGRRNALAKATGKQVDLQNRHTDIVVQKVCVHQLTRSGKMSLISSPERFRRQPDYDEQSTFRSHWKRFGKCDHPSKPKARSIPFRFSKSIYSTVHAGSGGCRFSDFYAGIPTNSIYQRSTCR